MKRKIYIESIFNEYSDLINNYIRRLQKIIETYDVVIFMARKAICFYYALRITNKISKVPSSCIMSSRVLTYDVLNLLKNKKIAIIDDVVVKGTSIEHSLKILNEQSLDYDVYLVACNDQFLEEYSSDIQKCIRSPYVVLSEFEICKLSKYIIQYIEVAMCPYNVDQPMFRLMFDDTADMNKFIQQNRFMDITSVNQKKLGIKNYVLHFESDFLANYIDKNIKTENFSVKIRFIKHEDKNEFLVLPFILFPQMSYEVIERLFENIISEKAKQIITNINELEQFENKYKMIQYFYSYKILQKYLENIDSEYKLLKINSNEIAQFSQVIISDNNVQLKEEFIKKEDLSFITQRSSEENGILFSEYLGVIYSFIERKASCMPDIKAFDSLGREIAVPIICYDEVLKKLKEYYYQQLDIYIVSSIIDILIDRGVLVPSIVHLENGKMLRAYKFGEIIKLSRIELQYFVAALSKYADAKEDLLGKTELEKLCVLFFRDGEVKRIFPRVSLEDGIESDYYAIAYTKYGPRVTHLESPANRSVERQKVEVLEALTLTRYLEDLKYIVHVKESKYQIATVDVDPEQKRVNRFILRFVYTLNALRESYPNTEEQEDLYRNQCGISTETDVFAYVSTYTKFLTLLAIGENTQDRLLSLMAEINLVTRINMTSTSKKDLINSMEAVLSAVTSGVWKYRCFCCENLLDDILAILSSVNSAVIPLTELVDSGRVEDRNDDLRVFLDECGRFLYRIVFIFYYITGKSYLNNYEWSNKSTLELREEIRRKYTKEYLTQEQQIANDILELIYEAKGRLDICDLYLKESAFNYQVNKKLIIIYSLGSSENKINEILGLPFQSDVISKEYLFRIERLDDNCSLDVQLDNLYDKSKMKNVKILICSMAEWYEGILNSLTIAKGTNFSHLLRSFFKQEKSRVYNPKSELSVCSSVGSEYDVVLKGYELVLTDDYQISSKYAVKRYDLFRKEKSNMDFSNSTFTNCAIIKENNAHLIVNQTNLQDAQTIQNLICDLELIKGKIEDTHTHQVIEEAEEEIQSGNMNGVKSKIVKMLSVGGEIVKTAIKELAIPTFKAYLVEKGINI